MKLTVNLEKDSYPIYIENNILSQAGNYIRKMYHGKRIMIISDDNVFPLYGDTLIRTLDSDYECHHLVLPHGEATKDFQTLPTVYKAMLEAKISRSDLVIALGGGVIGDLAGFAASSYLRGVRLVQIPTSLLNSRLGLFSATSFEALLFPKLRSHFAEFLNKGYPAHLRILSSPTCVGLRYGHLFAQ